LPSGLNLKIKAERPVPNEKNTFFATTTVGNGSDQPSACKFG